jgi:hypothetical protein
LEFIVFLGLGWPSWSGRETPATSELTPNSRAASKRFTCTPALEVGRLEGGSSLSTWLGYASDCPGCEPEPKPRMEGGESWVGWKSNYTQEYSKKVWLNQI